MLAPEYLKAVKMLDKSFVALPATSGRSCRLEDLKSPQIQDALANGPGRPLSGVDDNVLQMLAARSEILEAPRGTLLQSQWAEATHMNLLVSARAAVVHIHGTESQAAERGPLIRNKSRLPAVEVVGIAAPGEVLGESELLLRGAPLDERKHGVRQGCYRSTAIVTLPGIVLRCHDLTFILDDPKAHRLLANLGSVYCQTAYERLTRSERRSVHEKVRDILSKLVSLRDLVPLEGTSDWFRFAPRLSVDDLARLCGATKELVRLSLLEMTGRSGANDDDSLPDELEFGWIRGFGVVVPERTVTAIVDGTF